MLKWLRNRLNSSYLDISSNTIGACETLEGGGVGTTGEGVGDGAGAGGRQAGLFIFGGYAPFGPAEMDLVRSRAGFAAAARLTVGASPTTDEA